MDLKPKGSAAVFVLLVLFTLSKFSEAQNLCSVPDNLLVILIPENNAIGVVVTTLNAEDGVMARITSQNPEGFFSISGYDLIAETVLDYETFNPSKPHEVHIECTKAGSLSTTLNLKIAVEDINDNPPVFAYSQYTLNVDELSKVDTSVGLITATDPDKNDRLYYQLDSPEGEYALEANFNPNILVKKCLDYDEVKKVTMMLYVQDTPIGSTARVSHTASATIVVNIIDIDNRPPWFQPCTETEIDTSKICLMSGYNGNVNLNEQAVSPLSLEPGPLLAIDGDKGRNDPIVYIFLGGNEGGIFEINTDTGSITMQEPVKEAGTIVLSVMAYQKENADQFATTTVILKVVESTNFPPTFVKSSYEGFISEDAGVDSLVLESKTSNRPLRVQATDEDFPSGINPNLRFEIVDGTDFSITQEGFILMAKTVSPGTVNLEMRVVDTTNEESSTASLTVEVTPGVPTTTPATTIMTSSIITTESTANTKPTEITTATSHPGITTTTRPSTEGQQVKTGEFSSGDMAAVGASLAVVVVLCLVCIGLMVHRIKGHNADWKKLSEASVFQSTLGGGSGGPKEGVQYSNGGFQHDDDSGSVNSKIAADLENKLESGLKPQQRRGSAQKTTTPSSPPPDSSSLAETIDSEKEVKPILTKERRNEEGYKSVWFKQDIDPNTKEEVVIIPDTGEADGDREEDDDSEGENSPDGDSDDEEGVSSDL
ncbi:cadherin-related family member 5 [Sinocyclocheilus anshuiensis]|uniref:cadherin-related family member 5 n=1 Tax=Sinocyclocheilus anshuiensis TaxID=1608454 RepID=UPI0007BAB2BB|nr:PREDICTED: cadherin-related family member 5 [Sinocyclocheilus anshuiensis]